MVIFMYNSCYDGDLDFNNIEIDNSSKDPDDTSNLPMEDVLGYTGALCYSSEEIPFEDSSSTEEDNWFVCLENGILQASKYNDDTTICNDDATEERDNFQTSITDNEDNLLLYNGCPISLEESILLTLTLALRYDLSGECLADILSLIEMHCPSPNNCKKSLYKFKTYFKDLKSPLKFHRFCNICSMYVGENPTDKCCNELCRENLTGDINSSYFIEIPLNRQLANLFERKNFHIDILHRFNRSKQGVENLKDIYDGNLYKLHSKPGGFLSNPNNLSFTWYTDGAQVFKSSKASLWPIYLTVNELPMEKRMHPDNVIFAGLYFGEEKPCMTSYLKPFCEAISSLSTRGVDICCGHCNSTLQVKAMLLCGTCDLPAKAVVLNMTQFNGHCGCPHCKQPGEVVQVGRGHARVYPFLFEDVDGPLHTHKETLQSAKVPLALSKPIEGIKGPSWFSTLDGHDIIQGTAIDYMHGVLLGVVHLLLRLWFDTSFSSEAFSISKSVSLVDERLLSIKPPCFVTRLPRSIQKHKKFWKANECRAWLMYYSVPILFDILPAEYFQHYILLVEALYILNQQSITPEQLIHCKKVLIHFCSIFEAIYGESRMGINVHQLLHLTEVVQNLGPLWVYSCFTFESLNGKLVKMIHGPTKPIVQVANALTFMLKIPDFGEQLVPNSKPMALYNHLRGRGKQLSLGECICENKRNTM